MKTVAIITVLVLTSTGAYLFGVNQGKIQAIEKQIKEDRQSFEQWKQSMSEHHYNTQLNEHLVSDQQK